MKKGDGRETEIAHTHNIIHMVHTHYIITFVIGLSSGGLEFVQRQLGYLLEGLANLTTVL